MAPLMISNETPSDIKSVCVTVTAILLRNLAEQISLTIDYMQFTSKIVAKTFGGFRYFSYLCTCEREGYGHIGSIAHHDGGDAVDARDDRLAAH